MLVAEFYTQNVTILIKIISDLRRLVYDQTLAAINLVPQALPALQRRAISEALLVRIPVIYQTIQIERFTILETSIFQRVDFVPIK